MCTTDDIDGFDWFKETTVRARRSHKCAECNRPIVPGQLYVKTVGADSSGFEQYQTHAGCRAVAEFVRTKICEAEGEHGYILIGGLDSEISYLTDGYGERPLADEERADCLALGLEVEEWDEGEWRGSYTNVAEWVWDFAKELEASANG